MLVKRPIYNPQLKCVAFEILAKPEDAPQKNNDNMLQELILGADTQLPLFIPYGMKNNLEQFEVPVENPIILKLDADEISTNYPVEEIKDSPYSIALLVDTPNQLTYLNFAEYIGLSEQLMDGANLTKVVNFSKAKQRKVIAYGLGKPLSFDKCKAMTMDYFCGDFLFVPDENNQAEIAGSKLNVLNLIQSLQQDDCDFISISNMIQNDPILSFQLLKIANSAGFSGSQTIDSIDQAITRLGLVNLKNWIMVLSLKNISDKPVEILESGLIRAHMAQSLAKTRPEISAQSAYTAGLLSILDCLLNKPIGQLINEITISDEIKSALVERAGPLGELLTSVVAYEEGDWDKVSTTTITGDDLSKTYIECLSLVSKGTKAINGK